MKTQHTPGPWHIGMKPGPMIYGPKGEQVADMRGTLLDRDEHCANIRLIAAAPELLAALQLALKCANDHGADHFGYGEYADNARAAIAKAEGRA